MGFDGSISGMEVGAMAETISDGAELIKVIEDVSHAHGALYKGKLVGTIGHVGAMSVMSGKALPVGEGGFLITNDQEIYERSVAFGHYERTTKSLTLPELKGIEVSTPEVTITDEMVDERILRQRKIRGRFERLFDES